jgi:hypothetical protein
MAPVSSIVAGLILIIHNSNADCCVQRLIFTEIKSKSAVSGAEKIISPREHYKTDADLSI